MTVYWSDELRENKKPNRIEIPKRRKVIKVDDREPTKADLLEGQGLR